MRHRNNPHNPGPIQLIIVRCGGPSLIVPYIDETFAPFPVYSDSDGKLYEKLHMRRALDNIMQLNAVRALLIYVPIVAHYKVHLAIEC